MYQFFIPSDLADQRQRRILELWEAIYRTDSTVPANQLHPSRLPYDLSASCMFVELGGRPVRQAHIISAGEELMQARGKDPVGLTLEQFLTPSYLADVAPIYALCAAQFWPVSMLDETKSSSGVTRMVKRLMLPIGRRGEAPPYQAARILMAYSSLSVHTDLPAHSTGRVASIHSHEVRLLLGHQADPGDASCRAAAILPEAMGA
jgi:hypothetical protein